MKLLAISDLHGSLKNIEKLKQLLESHDYLIIPGDFSKHGDKESGENIINAIQDIKDKVISVHGNWDNNEIQDILNKNTIYE